MVAKFMEKRCVSTMKRIFLYLFFDNLLSVLDVYAWAKI